ncbi:sodium:proton antiporter [Maritimibacter sp. DP1N21-5]|uniref:cation:proton antiporter n=1 Tax=Maritimibacter sp. DP1N21-5 TaxID=2836867 RepID=UPI001C4842AB|nr:cation:proton antiporter [Maritimibacter sp. DP1N21-5]MBV7407485.1 cation:proton antiporter [Maritimibacter sp. DP1N21-5]
MIDSQLASFFDFETYHLQLAFVGTIVILALWLPRLVSRREPTAPPLMLLFAGAVTFLLPGFSPLPDPNDAPVIWERVSEMAVIVALFGAGMRIDEVGDLRRWVPAIRLLAVAMPLTIVAVAFLGAGLAGLSVAGAILLGAVLAPTDPVLASDVQVGPPHEGEERPVRFALTTEAGLNDGLAFPFVYLALFVAAEGLAPWDWGLEWVGVDVLYKIIVGGLAGWAGGRMLGLVLFNFPRNAVLAETGSGVIALAGVFLCYGSTELVEGYGFIAVAVMGFTLRRVEKEHEFHRRLHDFSEAIEHGLTAVLLVTFGSVLPLILADLSWAHAGIALILILVIRPLAGWVSLWRAGLPGKDRLFVATYGVRGIGSIYYLAYAASHGDITEQSDLWAIVAIAILLSTMLHGFTAGWAMDRLKKD